MDAGSTWYRVYNSTFGYDAYNPGFADTRFAPFDAVATGDRVASMYLADSQSAALVETVFHSVDISPAGDVPVVRAVVYSRKLREMLLAHMQCPSSLTVADLRDHELNSVGLERHQIVSTSREHYPCTRRLARRIHADSRRVDGILWHSRQADLARMPPAEVLILFGDRAPAEPAAWQLAGPGSRNLYEGPGRDLVDEVAVAVAAVVETGRDDGA